MEITKKRALLDLLGPKFSISSDYLYYKNKCVGFFINYNSLEVVDEKFGAFIERNDKHWNITVGIRTDLHRCPNFDKPAKSTGAFFWIFWVTVIILTNLVTLAIVGNRFYNGR